MPKDKIENLNYFVLARKLMFLMRKVQVQGLRSQKKRSLLM